MMMDHLLDLRLLDICPMLLHGVRDTSPLEYVRSHVLVRVHLRLDEVESLLRETLWYAHDAIHIADDDVAWVDDGVLFFAV